MLRFVTTIIVISIPLPAAFAQNDAYKTALANVVKLGGKVERTPQLDGTDLLGIALGEIKITDADLLTLRGLKHHKGQINLFLQGTNVGDEGVKMLAEMPQLNVVYLDRTKVTGTGLKDIRVGWLLKLREAPVTDEGLKALPRTLPQLDLWGTSITDASLRELKGMKQLRTLTLGKTRITDAGLKEVAALSGLQRLSLDDTKVTDAGMKELQKLTGLQRLDLNGTAVTVAGLGDLKNMGLSTLQLARTKLSDADLEIFKSPDNFKALRNLYVGETQVSKKGLNALRKARPGLWR